MSLNASTQSATGAGNRPASSGRDCMECGGSCAPAKQPRDFCSATCRQTFNNRRMQRGAEIYDLLMAIRYQRDRATDMKLWRWLNRLAKKFRDQDNAERQGRKSWRAPELVLRRHAYLKADVLGASGKSRR